MNVSWILCGLLALATGIGRSFAYVTNLQPLAQAAELPVQSWFTTVWFLVSGLFVFSAIVFLAIGIRPKRFASQQLAILMTCLFAVIWSIIAVLNLGFVESPTTRPLIPIGVMVVLGAYGIFRGRATA